MYLPCKGCSSILTGNGELCIDCRERGLPCRGCGAVLVRSNNLCLDCRKPKVCLHCQATYIGFHSMGLCKACDWELHELCQQAQDKCREIQQNLVDSDITHAMINPYEYYGFDKSHERE